MLRATPNSGGAIEVTGKFNPFHLKTGTQHTGYEDEMTSQALWIFLEGGAFGVVQAAGHPNPILSGEEFSVPVAWVDLEPLFLHQSP